MHTRSMNIYIFKGDGKYEKHTYFVNGREKMVSKCEMDNVYTDTVIAQAINLCLYI